MPRPSRTRVHRRAAIPLVLAATALTSLILLLATVDPHLNGAGIFAGGADLHVYRDGAFRILRDLPLYTTPVLFGLQYTYTPFSTLVFVPIEQIPWGAVNTVWMVTNIGVLFACIMLCWRLLGYRADPALVLESALLTATCLFLEPVRTTLFYGQINLVLMLLVLWDFTRGEGSRLRGVGVGLAAGIKLTPLYFVAVFVVLRQWRSAVTAAATFAGSIAVAWLLLPADSHQYWTTTFFQSTRIADDTHPSNQSIRGVIAHVTGHPTPTWLWLLLAGSVTLLSLWATARLHERGEHLLAVTLSGLTAAAVSPFSWSHHWVWFVPLAADLVHRARSNAWWFAPAAGLYLAAGAWPHYWSDTNVVIGLFLSPPSWPITAVLVNIHVLLYAGVLAGSAVTVARRRDSPTTPPRPVPPVRMGPVPLRT